ncbi:hypothetical protein [Arthrobacter koreensis]|uniref:hypothetical protein n=1 Tax=Arthrobacter koreensis TaxID=199136 RepID=UPI00126452B1|nr:hypothetical protein [Arthrobacter koreensis]
MLPHSARPAESEEGVHTAGANDGAGSGQANSNRMPDRDGLSPAGTTSSAAFVPPLAPSPPPGTPPTVHTRMDENRSSRWQNDPEPVSMIGADVQEDSFNRVLRGETTSNPSGRAYHLRGSFNPLQAIQRLVTGRPMLEGARNEALEGARNEAGQFEAARQQYEAEQVIPAREQHELHQGEAQHEPDHGKAAGGDAQHEPDHGKAPGGDAAQHDPDRGEAQHEPDYGKAAGGEAAQHEPDHGKAAGGDAQQHEPGQGEAAGQIAVQGEPEYHQPLPVTEEPPQVRNTNAANHPSPDHDSQQADTIRRIAVTMSTAAALGFSYALTRTATGWPGINHGPGSVLDPAASLLGVYPWIWLAWIPVLTGAAAYAALQWIPSQRSNPRRVWNGPISAGSAVVAAIWLWAVQSGNPAGAFWSAALGTGIGLAAIHISNTWPVESRTEKATVDLPAKVLLGASTIALLTGLGSWLTALETDIASWGPVAWALIALVATVIGITTVSMTDRGHLAAALTAVVGLSGIGFTRLLSEQNSIPVAAGAFVGAFLILVSAGSRRHQVDHAQRRRQREWLRAEASVRAGGEAPEAVHT